MRPTVFHRCLALTVMLLLAVTTARADKVFLTDGRVIEGQVAEAGDRIGVITPEGVQWFRRDQVARVEPGLLKQVDPAVRQAFLAAKAKVKRLDSPADAVALWETYIAEDPKSPLLPLAMEEIRRWKKAAKDGLVIWAGKPVWPEQRDAAQKEAVELIDAGIALHDAGTFAEARKQLEKAGRLWPDHPTVSFYSGLVLRQLRRPIEAARSFAEVLDTIPEHVPSMNNTACVCARLSDYRSAVTFLARALRRDADNSILVDNAWEVLHAMEAEKKGDVLRPDLLKISRDNLKVLTDACTAQRNRMAKVDKHRWGSAWISKAELDRHIARSREIRQRLETIAREVRLIQARITGLDNRIDVVKKMRAACLQNNDAGGALVFQRQLKDLYAERADLEQQEGRLLAEGRELQKQRPEPAWSGELVMMGVQSPVSAMAAQPQADQAIRTVVRSGKTVMVGGDGVFLGRASAGRHHPKSIWNPLSPHGSGYSKRSVFDERSPYGRWVSYLSVRDPRATKPPRLMLDGTLVCYVTTNASFEPRITLETLVALLRGR